MKRFVFLLFSALLLSGCSKGNEVKKEAFSQFVFPNSSVYGDYYVTYNNNRTITYYDLAEGTSSPACILAGCSHDGKMPECTAHFNFGMVWDPFIWNDSLCYFFDGDGAKLYKCDLNGSGRREIFSLQKEKLSETEILTPCIREARSDGSVIYVLIYDYVSVIDIKTGGTSEDAEAPQMGFRIFTIDLQTEKSELFYETEKAYSASFSMFGVFDGMLYCYSCGQSENYSFENFDDKLAAISDENSEYNKTFFKRNFALSTSDKSVTELENSSIYLSKAGVYINGNNSVYSTNGEIITDFTPEKIFACAEGLIYCKNGETFIYSNNETRKTGDDDGSLILSESENYFIMVTQEGKNAYCSKKDFYSGKPVYFPLEV